MRDSVKVLFIDPADCTVSPGVMHLDPKRIACPGRRYTDAIYLPTGDILQRDLPSWVSQSTS